MIKPSYLAHVDGLRAIAVLSVFLFHLGVPGFSGGYVGVDVFFVISGFLITRVLRHELESRGRLDLVRFYRRRVKRLGPALLVTLLATFFVASLVFSTDHLQRMGGALASSLFSVSNFFFWLEADYFDTSAQFKPLLHTWSLSVEEQFYFFWPLTLVLLYKLNLKQLILPALFAISLVSLFLNFVFSDGHSAFLSRNFPGVAELTLDGKSTLFFLLPFRVFEFGVGAGLVWLFDRRLPHRFLYDALMWLGVASIAFSVSVFDESLIFPYWYALVPCFGTALVIYAGAGSYSRIFLTNRLAVSIGLSSYSLYLIHWPIIVFWAYLQGGEPNLIDAGVIFLLSFALSFLSFRFIEQPFRYPQAFSSKPAWGVALSATFLLLVTTSMHAYSTGGWAWRMSDPVVNLEDVGDSGQFHKAFYGGAGYPYYGPVGSSNEPDIVLLGDSHGRHYAEGLNSLFVREKGMELFIASGSSCFHLPGFTRATKGQDWDHICTRGLQRGLSYINSAESSPVVVISHAWSSQVPIAAFKENKSESIGVTQIIEGLLQLKALIGDAPLIVIGNLPRPGANLYDIFTRPRPLLFSGFDPSQYLSSKPDQGLKAFNDSLQKAADETGAFEFVDPFDYLCTDVACTNIDNERRLLYSDTNHLSKYGSVYLIGSIRPVIERALDLNGNR